MNFSHMSCFLDVSVLFDGLSLLDNSFDLMSLFGMLFVNNYTFDSLCVMNFDNLRILFGQPSEDFEIFLVLFLQSFLLIASEGSHGLVLIFMVLSLHELINTAHESLTLFFIHLVVVLNQTR